MKIQKASVLRLMTIYNANFVAFVIIFDKIVFYETLQFKEYS